MQFRAKLNQAPHRKPSRTPKYFLMSCNANIKQQVLVKSHSNIILKFYFPVRLVKWSKMMHFPKPRKKVKGKIDLSRLNTAQASSVSQRGLPPSPVHHAENHLRSEVSVGSFHYSRLSFLLLFLCRFRIGFFLYFNYNVFNFTSVLVFNLNDCCS